jgi:hypothetical protein
MTEDLRREIKHFKIAKNMLDADRDFLGKLTCRKTRYCAKSSLLR